MSYAFGYNDFTDPIIDDFEYRPQTDEEYEQIIESNRQMAERQRIRNRMWNLKQRLLRKWKPEVIAQREAIPAPF